MLYEVITGGKVVNMPKRFIIGNHNFELQPDEITICGAFVSEKVKNPLIEMKINENMTAHRYFEGVIRDGQVVGWGLSEPMKLCAINTDAKVVITSYSIHYTKLYESNGQAPKMSWFGSIPQNGSFGMRRFW